MSADPQPYTQENIAYATEYVCEDCWEPICEMGHDYFAPRYECNSNLLEIPRLLATIESLAKENRDYCRAFSEISGPEGDYVAVRRPEIERLRGIAQRAKFIQDCVETHQVWARRDITPFEYILTGLQETNRIISTRVPLPEPWIDRGKGDSVNG